MFHEAETNWRDFYKGREAHKPGLEAHKPGLTVHTHLLLKDFFWQLIQKVLKT